MLRCAASFVVAAYSQVRLAPHDLRALPAELFTKPSNFVSFWAFLRVHHSEKFASPMKNGSQKPFFKGPISILPFGLQTVS
jgi:hypothetical protein